MRAQKLSDVYRKYESLESIPDMERQALERDIFRASLDSVWQETTAFFAVRNPEELVRAQSPKVRMALIFRWYLGQASRWAVEGTPDREIDYQIWCGPAMGAFNDWARGSYLETPENRRVADIARVLMSEAAALYKSHAVRMSDAS